MYYIIFNILIYRFYYLTVSVFLQVLCFHLGMTEGFVWDLGTPSESLADRSEVLAILREIHHEFVKNDNVIQFSHKVSRIGCGNIRPDYRSILAILHHAALQS